MGLVMLAVLLAGGAPAHSGESVNNGALHVMQARRVDAKGVWVLSGVYTRDPAASATNARTLGTLLGDEVDDATALATASGALRDGLRDEHDDGEAMIARLSANTLVVSFVGHLGVIRVRAGTAERAVLPHSIIEDFIKQKNVPPADQEKLRLQAPYRFVTVRKLGGKTPPAVERVELPVKKGDRYALVNVDVLASVPLGKYAELIGAAKTPDEAAKQLTALARNARPDGSPAAIVISMDSKQVSEGKFIGKLNGLLEPRHCALGKYAELIGAAKTPDEAAKQLAALARNARPDGSPAAIVISMDRNSV